MPSDEQELSAQNYLDGLQQHAATMIAQSRAMEAELAHVSGATAEDQRVSVTVDATCAITELTFFPNASNCEPAQLRESVMAAYQAACIHSNQTTADVAAQFDPAMAQRISEALPPETISARDQEDGYR